MVLGPGATVCVLATDPAARRDFADFSEATGHLLLDVNEDGQGVLWLVVQKRAG